MPRTPLFANKTPGGVLAIESMDLTTGNRWYVHSGTGTDSAGYGKSPDSPFDTIDYAVGNCTASNGDIIYVMPGHTETISAASSLDLDVAGIKVIGLGWGDTRPTLDFTAAASTVEVNADDIWIENLIFSGNFTDGVTAALDLKTGADDFVCKACTFRGTASTKELLTAVTIEATISRVYFIDCDFYEVTGGDALSAIATEGAISDLRVINCFFSGDYNTAVLDLDAGSNAIVRAHVIDCDAFNADVAAGLFAILDSGSVVHFVRCTHGLGKANTVPVTDGSASVFIDCVGTDAANLSSLIFPASATAWS